MSEIESLKTEIENLKRYIKKQEEIINQQKINCEESNYRFHNILESTITGLIEVNTEGKIIFANTSAENILRLKKDTITKYYFSDITWKQVDSEGEPYPIEKLPLSLALFEKKSVENIEHGIIDNEGHVIWLSVNASPLFNLAGELYGAVANFIDISEQKETQDNLRESEKKLRQNEEYYRNIFSYSGTGMALINSAGIVKDVNIAFTEISGYSREELIGSFFPKYILSDTEIFISPYKKVRNSDLIEIKLKHKWGEYIWILLGTTYITDNIYSDYLILAQIQDITAIKFAEISLKKNEKLLSHSQEMANVGSWELNLDTKEFFLSREASLLLEKTPETKVDLNTFLNLLSHESKEKLKKLIQDMEKSSNSFEINLELRTFNHNNKHIKARGELVTDEYGVKSIISSILDITEFTSIQEELLYAKQKAEDAYRAKSLFLANISHEIRTPLNSILGFSSILINRINTIQNTERKQYLNNIHTSGRVLMELLEDILDISKIEAGKLVLKKGDLDIEDLIRVSKNLFEDKCKEKQIKFYILVQDNIPKTLETDPTRIRQILFNLISNSVKFTEKGYVKLHINIQEEEKQYYLIIAVEDTGPGIPSEEKESIFESFTQKQNQDPKFGGTGLGLTIVKHLVELLKGNLSLHSELGQGSVFTVKIPVALKSNETFQKIYKSTELLFEKNESTLETYSEVIREEMQQVSYSLENLFLAEWKEIFETMVINDIIIFLEKVEKEIENKESCKIIKQWLERVNTHTRTFDLDRLSQDFSKFPEILKSLRKES
ncbi:MAG: PAS domain S-box protein [Leptospiraceae bacterium]|nr:PAS domain S-box protein [Leptospiraceae bacterium]MCP5501040.1 PAS domain S-box protein [Leptospiraceae bacterium]